VSEKGEVKGRRRKDERRKGMCEKNGRRRQKKKKSGECHHANLLVRNIVGSFIRSTRYVINELETEVAKKKLFLLLDALVCLACLWLDTVRVSPDACTIRNIKKNLASDISSRTLQDMLPNFLP
jgi:hypothetical protein